MDHEIAWAAEIAAQRARIAELEARLDDVMREGDLEHARMAALYEACEVFADFALSYDQESALAHAQPAFYGLLRVYGKNARAAVRAVRGQADAFVAELTAARAYIAEMRETIEGCGCVECRLLAAYDAARKGAPE